MKILRLGKKHVISTPVYLSLFFQEKMRLIKRELGGQGGGVVIKRGRWNIHNSLFDHLREDVNKWKYGKWVDIFPKN